MEMTSMRRLLVVVAAVTVATAALASASPAAAPKLIGTVGPGYTITLTQGGKKVTKLKAGTYRFVINDKSSMHSYGLDGPKGFAKDFTSVPFKGIKTFTLKLKAGKYKYYCQAHESAMFGNFTVSS
jgi:plastocyanin